MLKQDKWYSNTTFTHFRNRFINDVFNCDYKQLLKICLDRAGSCVIETCIKSANRRQLNAFVEFVKGDDGLNLDELIKSKFGNYVVRTLVNKCSNEANNNNNNNDNNDNDNDDSLCYKEYLRMIINTIHLYICDLYTITFYYDYDNVQNGYNYNYNRRRSKYGHAQLLIEQCRKEKNKIDVEYYSRK